MSDRPAADAFPAGDTGPFTLDAPIAAPPINGALRLGSFRSVWASPEVEHAPALKFLSPKQRAELNPDDAAERGIRHGQPVRVSAGATTVDAVAHLRTTSPRGSVFLESGIGPRSADALRDDRDESGGLTTVSVELVRSEVAAG